MADNEIPASKIKIGTDRVVALPRLDQNERLEAEVWWEPENKKKKPLWLWMTDLRIYFQSKKLFAVSDDSRVDAIPLHRIRQFQIIHNNGGMLRLLGFVLFVFSIGGIAAVYFADTEANYRHVHLPLMGIALGFLMLVGVHRVKISIRYQSGDGREPTFVYRSPLLFSRNESDSLFLQVATLINWVRLKGIRTDVSPSFDLYWKRFQMGKGMGSGSSPEIKPNVLTRVFALQNPVRIIHFLPGILLLIAAACVDIIVAEAILNDNLAGVRTDAIVSLIITLLAGLVFYLPVYLRRRKLKRFASQVLSGENPVTEYVGVITHTSPYMVAVNMGYVDEPIIKVVRCPELDAIPVIQLPVGSRVYCRIRSDYDKEAEGRLSLGQPFVARIAGNERLYAEAARIWDVTIKAVAEIPFNSAPGLYGMGAERVIRLGHLWETHNAFGR